MNEAAQLALSAASGVVLGAAFFAGLWWTIRRGLASRAPALWFFGSLWIRMGLAVGGLYVIAHGDWRRLGCCLIGFLGARTVLIHRARRFGMTSVASILAGALP